MFFSYSLHGLNAVHSRFPNSSAFLRQTFEHLQLVTNEWSPADMRFISAALGLTILSHHARVWRSFIAHLRSFTECFALSWSHLQTIHEVKKLSLSQLQGCACAHGLL